MENLSLPHGTTRDRFNPYAIIKRWRCFLHYGLDIVGNVGRRSADNKFPQPIGRVANFVDSTLTKEAPLLHYRLFEKMIGRWFGICQTWFEPDKLEDESAVCGEISYVLAGRFLRHTYTGRFGDKPRQGEELIAVNTQTDRYQVTWIDDFHMNQAILFSQGVALETGFSVLGWYDVGQDIPQWGWRTNYDLLDDNRLTITAYNISPAGVEAKAVETAYRRQIHGRQQP